MDLRQRYLDLLEGSLTHTLYDALVAPAGGVRQRSLAALSRRGFGAGLPPPRDHAADAGARWHRWSDLAVPLDEVRANFRRFGLSHGGYVIVDDYGAVPACRRAVDDFRAEHDIGEPLHRIDWTGAYWRRD